MAKCTKINNQTQWTDFVKSGLKYVGLKSKLMGFQSLQVKQLHNDNFHP